MLRPAAAVGADRRQREGGGVEPLLDQLLARPAAVELRIADEVGAIVGEAVEVAILPGGDRQRRAALQRDDRRDRPVVRAAPARSAPRVARSSRGSRCPRARSCACDRPTCAPRSQLDAVRVLHRRQAAALIVDVLERLAERVVGLRREAAAAPLGAQLQAVVVAAEDRLEHARRRRCTPGMIRPPRVDVGRRRARPEHRIVAIDARRQVASERADVRRASR